LKKKQVLSVLGQLLKENLRNEFRRRQEKQYVLVSSTLSPINTSYHSGLCLDSWDKMMMQAKAYGEFLVLPSTQMALFRPPWYVCEGCCTDQLFQQPLSRKLWHKLLLCERCFSGYYLESCVYSWYLPSLRLRDSQTGASHSLWSQLHKSLLS